MPPSHGDERPLAHQPLAPPSTRSPLDDVRIASPCQADWSEMAGDDRVRFCGQCQKNVYNLIAMPRDDAEALLRESEGQPCLRLYRRADGTVLTADCPEGVRYARRRRRLALLARSAALSAAAATYSACQSSPTEREGVGAPSSSIASSGVDAAPQAAPSGGVGAAPRAAGANAGAASGDLASGGVRPTQRDAASSSAGPAQREPAPVEGAPANAKHDAAAGPPGAVPVDPTQPAPPASAPPAQAAHAHAAPKARRPSKQGKDPLKDLNIVLGRR